MDIPKERYNEIIRWIASDESPVGIDAKHTHVIIIHKLMEIEKRLAALEAGGSGTAGGAGGPGGARG